MDTRKTTYSVRRLLDAWDLGKLRRNPEYQRGAAWSVAQKQALIDSAFRLYPIPPLLLDKKADANGPSYEVVDGHRRLLAFSEYCAGEFALLDTQDRRLRLPNSLRALPAPWAQKKYVDLDSDLQKQLDETLIDVYELDDVRNADEIRDLFIRLQSGTALTRQQVRDAWPGNVGPYIEHLAGKLSQRPAEGLFRLINKRSARHDEEHMEDEYVSDRQTCAQLLRLFLARERDPRATAGVGADDLDALYHENTNFDRRGDSARRFERCLEEARDIFELAAPMSVFAERTGARRKVRKIDAFAAVLFFQDVLRNPHSRIIDQERMVLAKRIAEFEKSADRNNRGTSGLAIRGHYERFRSEVTVDRGLGAGAF